MIALERLFYKWDQGGTRPSEFLGLVVFAWSLSDAIARVNYWYLIITKVMFLILIVVSRY